MFAVTSRLGLVDIDREATTVIRAWSGKSVVFTRVGNLPLIFIFVVNWNILGYIERGHFSLPHHTTRWKYIPVQNILIRSGLFHTWFTPETCLKYMQIKNFTCETRLNMPDIKFTPISCMKNFTLDSCLNFFTPVHMWKLSRIPTMPHCESTNHICSFKHTLNQSHPSKQLWFSDESSPPFWRLVVKHAMDICYIFLSSNEYIKKR